MRTSEAEQTRYTWPTAEKAAKQIGGISQTHVMRLVADGELRARNVARKGARRPSWRIDPESLSAFIDRRTYR